MLYCSRCNKLNEPSTKRCGCGYKKLREPLGGDAVFLATVDFVHGRMLKEVLHQNNIPVLAKPVVASLAVFLARSHSASNHFFVPLAALEKAKELYEELFGASESTVES